MEVGELSNKVMRLFFLGWLIYLNIANSYSQNLISNGSFEEHTDCCKYYGQIEAATGWFQLSGSTDYFNGCCPYEDFLGVPDNKDGHQQPKHGNAYAGFGVFAHDSDFYFREYLHTKLNRPLKKDKVYRITFYISLAEKSKLYTNHISVCFSREKQLGRSKVPYDLLKCNSRVTYWLSEEEAKDMVKWQKIEIDYVAKGGEEYMAIGSFEGDLSKSKHRRIRKKNVINRNGLHCYYYIDDVSVVVVDDKTEYSHEH